MAFGRINANSTIWQQIQVNYNQNTKVLSQENAFENIACKLVAISGFDVAELGSYEQLSRTSHLNDQICFPCVSLTASINR